jgi:hypothetical protein
MGGLAVLLIVVIVGLILIFAAAVPLAIWALHKDEKRAKAAADEAERRT